MRSSRMMQFSLRFWSGYLHQPKIYYNDSLILLKRKKQKIMFEMGEKVIYSNFFAKVMQL